MEMDEARHYPGFPEVSLALVDTSVPPYSPCGQRRVVIACQFMNVLNNPHSDGDGVEIC